MRRAQPAHTSIWILCCIALLAVRSSGPYLHLSSDSDEPPVSVLFGAGGAQGDSGPGDPYPVDIDVDFVKDGISKVPKIDFDLPALSAAVIAYDMPCIEPDGAPSSVPPVLTPSSWWRMRPPLRAPPV